MPSIWGTDKQGESVYRIKLSNKRGMQATITNYGARLIGLSVPTNEQGNIDVVLSLPTLEHYLEDSLSLGATVGRYCNRIQAGRLPLEGKIVQLDCNAGEHHLHGGEQGFNHRTWTVLDSSPSSLSLGLTSPDGDQAYPGRLEVQVDYELTDDNELLFRWQAKTDAATVVSLTNHSYFNLAGQGDIGQHLLHIPTEHYTPTSNNGIPTGEIRPVVKSDLDFSQWRQLSTCIPDLPPALSPFGGLDHNWAFDAADSEKLMAELACLATQLLMQIRSDLPGLQCYTGNHLDGTGIHACFSGIAMESQYYPDSPNQPDFPSATLLPGETMTHLTRFSFLNLNEAQTASLKAVSSR